MTANDSGRQSGFDGLVVIIAACCIAAGMVAAVRVALLTGNDMRSRVETGVPWAAIVPAGLGAMALTVCALVVIWSVAMARGSTRGADQLVELMLMSAMVFVPAGWAFDRAWLVLLGIGVCLLAYPASHARNRLRHGRAEPVAVSVRRHQERIQALDATAGEQTYPYPEPLPADAKQGHLAQAAAAQSSAMFWGRVALAEVVLSVAAVALRMTGGGEIELWHAVMPFWLPLLVAFQVSKELSKRNRHVALLRAYGVEVDDRGKEPRLGAASC